jgi:hypothetical protein
MPVASETKASVCAVVPGEDGEISLYPSLWKHPPTPAPSHTALSQHRKLPRVEVNTFCSAINDRPLYLIRNQIWMFCVVTEVKPPFFQISKVQGNWLH